ncbi:uncharacterized protein METZ01_LOCUS778 [marine metagenome]|uniref:Uncharacterized protein n=1 Tax=marine metagenome TaxID=408172 RepID=A0A381N1J8_9ZZZZ
MFGSLLLISSSLDRPVVQVREIFKSLAKFEISFALSGVCPKREISTDLNPASLHLCI